LEALNAPVVGSGGGGSGPAFRELMPHFILGSDEACHLASDGGKVKVFGDKGKHKHEKILADSRVSITILRTGGDCGCCGGRLGGRVRGRGRVDGGEGGGGGA